MSDTLIQAIIQQREAKLGRRLTPDEVRALTQSTLLAFAIAETPLSSDSSHRP